MEYGVIIDNIEIEELHIHKRHYITNLFYSYSSAISINYHYPFCSSNLSFVVIEGGGRGGMRPSVGDHLGPQLIFCGHFFSPFLFFLLSFSSPSSVHIHRCESWLFVSPERSSALVCSSLFTLFTTMLT